MRGDEEAPAAGIVTTEDEGSTKGIGTFLRKGLTKGMLSSRGLGEKSEGAVLLSDFLLSYRIRLRGAMPLRWDFRRPQAAAQD